MEGRLARGHGTVKYSVADRQNAHTLTIGEGGAYIPGDTPGIEKGLSVKPVINGIGAHLPERVVTNDDLSHIVDTSDEWIYSHTGIRARRIAGDSVATSDLAVEASRRAIARSSIEPDEIDLVLLATSTPDYPGLPATASIVQDKLGILEAGAMDLVAACSGFVYALDTARAYVVSGTARNVLVIGSEVYSRILNWEDRSTCVLFGDGAGSVIVSAAEDEVADGRGILDGYLRSKGSGYHTLWRKAGGSRNPVAPENESDRFLSMDGRAVYNFAVSAIIETIDALLSRHRLTMDDVAYVVPHQANLRIIQAACKRAGFPEGKFFTNLERYANTSAASIPIAMEELAAGGRVSPGDLLLTVGFGSGLAYGGNLIRW